MTIKELAELAGVSPAAVSLALNNKPGVSEETRKQIMEIATAQGYIKKSVAQRKKILFIKYIGSGAAIEQNGDFIARVIDAIELSSRNLGYNLAIMNIAADDFERALEEVHFDDYLGLIFLGTEALSENIAALKNLSIPVVAVDNLFENHNIDSVVMDNYGGIYGAVEYLVSLGHRKIGYIDSTLRLSNFIHRTDAYHKAMSQLGLSEHICVKHVSPTLEGAYTDMSDHMRKGFPLPTAFVAANDTIAIGAIKCFKEFGVEIPKQLSVVGFDDIPFCMMLDKTLTTMRVNKERLGSAAVKLLDEKITAETEECVKLQITTKLIVRESACALKE